MNFLYVLEIKQTREWQLRFDDVMGCFQTARSHIPNNYYFSIHCCHSLEVLKRQNESHMLQNGGKCVLLSEEILSVINSQSHQNIPGNSAQHGIQKLPAVNTRL